MAQYSAFQTWIAAELNGELFNKLDYSVSPEARITIDNPNRRSIHAELDLSTRVTGFFKVGGQYRIQQKNYIEDYSYLVNRYGLYGRFNTRIDKLRIAYRAMYQWEYVGYNQRENGNIPLQEQRHKLSLSYYKKKWELRPETSIELFFVTKPEYVYQTFKYRFSAGFEYDLTKEIDLGISYKLQQEYFEPNPATAHILALKFSYSL